MQCKMHKVPKPWWGSMHLIYSIIRQAFHLKKIFQLIQTKSSIHQDEYKAQT